MAIRQDKVPDWSLPPSTVCSEPYTCDCPPPPLNECMDGVIDEYYGGIGQPVKFCHTNNGWDILINAYDWYYGTDGPGGNNSNLSVGEHCSVTLKCTEEGNCGGQGGYCGNFTGDMWFLPGSTIPSEEWTNPFPNNDIWWYDGWCDPAQNPDESPGRSGQDRTPPTRKLQKGGRTTPTRQTTSPPHIKCPPGQIWDGSQCVPAFQPASDDYDVLQDIIDINNLPQTVDEMIGSGRTEWENDRLVSLDLNCYLGFGGELPCYAPPESPYLTQLPESIGNLTELRLFYAAGNKLTDLPNNFGNLVSMEDLAIYGNELGALDSMMNDDVFENLTNLRYLRIHANPLLMQLPESICNCSSLVELYAYNTLGDNYNDGLWFLPECLGQLTNLKKLHVKGNQMEAIDFDICNMTSLEEVYLNNNNLIGDIPECIVGMGFEYGNFQIARNKLWCDYYNPETGCEQGCAPQWYCDNTTPNGPFMGSSGCTSDHTNQRCDDTTQRGGRGRTKPKRKFQKGGRTTPTRQTTSPPHSYDAYISTPTDTTDTISDIEDIGRSNWSSGKPLNYKDWFEKKQLESMSDKELLNLSERTAPLPHKPKQVPTLPVDTTPGDTGDTPYEFSTTMCCGSEMEGMGGIVSDNCVYYCMDVCNGVCSQEINMDGWNAAGGSSYSTGCVPVPGGFGWSPGCLPYLCTVCNSNSPEGVPLTYDVINCDIYSSDPVWEQTGNFQEHLQVEYSACNNVNACTCCKDWSAFNFNLYANPWEACSDGNLPAGVSQSACENFIDNHIAYSTCIYELPDCSPWYECYNFDANGQYLNCNEAEYLITSLNITDWGNYVGNSCSSGDINGCWSVPKSIISKFAECKINQITSQLMNYAEGVLPEGMYFGELGGMDALILVDTSADSGWDDFEVGISGIDVGDFSISYREWNSINDPIIIDLYIGTLNVNIPWHFGLIGTTFEQAYIGVECTQSDCIDQNQFFHFEFVLTPQFNSNGTLNSYNFDLGSETGFSSGFTLDLGIDNEFCYCEDECPPYYVFGVPVPDVPCLLACIAQCTFGQTLQLPEELVNFAIVDGFVAMTVQSIIWEMLGPLGIDLRLDLASHIEWFIKQLEEYDI